MKQLSLDYPPVPYLKSTRRSKLRGCGGKNIVGGYLTRGSLIFIMSKHIKSFLLWHAQVSSAELGSPTYLDSCQLGIVLRVEWNSNLLFRFSPIIFMTWKFTYFLPISFTDWPCTHHYIIMLTFAMEPISPSLWGQKMLLRYCSLNDGVPGTQIRIMCGLNGKCYSWICWKTCFCSLWSEQILNIFSSSDHIYFLWWSMATSETCKNWTCWSLHKALPLAFICITPKPQPIHPHAMPQLPRFTAWHSFSAKQTR